MSFPISETGRRALLWSKYRDKLIFIGFVFLAFVIRVIGIDWGLPGQNFPHSQFIVDETFELYATVLLGKGVYQLGVIRYQPFFYFASFPAFIIHYLIGSLSGEFSSWESYFGMLDSDISPLFVPGRLFIVAIGSVTVGSLYLIGSRLYSRRVGFISAIFLLFSFGHVVYSRIFRLDSFLPFLMLLAIYSIIRLGWAKREKLGPFVISGLTVGMAATTKVTGFSLAVPLLLYPLINGVRMPKFPFVRPSWDKRYPFALTIFVATVMALVLPYLVFSAQQVETTTTVGIGETAGRAVSISQGLAGRYSEQTVKRDTYAISKYRISLPWHLSSTLPNQLSWPVYLLAVTGSIIMLVDRQHRRQNAYLLLAVVAFLVPIGLLRRAPWRDMIPILPVLFLIAGYGLIRLFEVFSSRFPSLAASGKSTWLLVIIVILIIVLPMAKVAQHLNLITNEDTRQLAADWIEANLPSGSNLALEPFAPPLLDERYKPEVLAAIEAEAPNSNRSRYILHDFIPELGGARPPEEVVPFLIEKDIDFVILSSAYYGRFYNGALDVHNPGLAEMGRGMHDVIASELILVQQFIPDWQDRPGPLIQVYEVPPGIDASSEPSGVSFEPYPTMAQPASAVGYYQFAPR